MNPVLAMPRISCTPAELEFVRSKFRESVNETPELYEATDIAQSATDEWTVKRFIAYKKHDLDEAAAALIKAMKWRKVMDVSNIKVTDFPAEFFWTGECHEYVRDKNNCGTVYCRVKFHKPLAEFMPITKRFLIYLMERMDDEIRRGSNGWALIYDCDGGTIFNNNMEILFFMIETLFEYYPMALTYVGLFELPWVMRAIYHICRGWIPEDYRNLIKFMNKSSIDEVVGKQNLPQYLNGTCPLHERKRITSMSMREFVMKHNMKESAVSRFFAHYQKYLDMGDQREREESEKTRIEAMTQSSGNTTMANNVQPVESLLITC